MKQQASTEKQIFFVWSVVVLVGSFYTQFLFKNLNQLWLLWWFLVCVALVLTSLAVDWLQRRDRVVQLGWIGAVFALLLATQLSFNVNVPYAVLQYMFVWWSIALSVGYGISGWLVRWKRLQLLALYSLVVVPFFFVPWFGAYHALLFGLGHGAVLGYLWWKS